MLCHTFALSWQFLEPLIPSPAVGSPMSLRHASYKALVLCYRGNFWTPGAVASAKGHIGSGRRQRRAFLCRSSMQSATEVIVHSIFCKVTPLLPCALSLGGELILFCTAFAAADTGSPVRSWLLSALCVHCYAGYCRYKLAELTQASLVLSRVLEGFA